MQDTKQWWQVWMEARERDYEGATVSSWSWQRTSQSRDKCLFFFFFFGREGFEAETQRLKFQGWKED